MLLFRCQAAAAVATLLIASSAAFDGADFGLDMCEDYEDEPENCADDTCDCPEGFRVCAGRCYMAGPDTLPYTAAEAYCESVGAHLATPRSVEENTCLSGLFQGFAWLGYSGGTNAGNPHVGADDGTPVGYANWAPGVATYLSQCVAIYQLFWFDDSMAYCGSSYYPLCQLTECHRPQCPDATPPE